MLCKTGWQEETEQLNAASLADLVPLQRSLLCVGDTTRLHRLILELVSSHFLPVLSRPVSPFMTLPAEFKRRDKALLTAQ